MLERICPHPNNESINICPTFDRISSRLVNMVNKHDPTQEGVGGDYQFETAEVYLVRKVYLGSKIGNIFKYFLF